MSEIKTQLTEEQISKKVIDIVYLYSPNNRTITPDTSLEEAGIESIDLVNVRIDIGAEFEISVKEHEITGINTVKNIIDLVKSKI